MILESGELETQQHVDNYLEIRANHRNNTNSVHVVLTRPVPVITNVAARAESCP